MSARERHFLGGGDETGFSEYDLQPVLGQLQVWLDRFEQALDADTLSPSGLYAEGSLAQRLLLLNAEIQASRRRWHEQWTMLQPAQALAQDFDDRVMLLIFGKFNAGKSSLCNFLASRFRQEDHRVQYFHLTAGQLHDTEDCFQEGATETTARLQGVCLGDWLVLLDTPGLHSTTEDNVALTQRFLESADAVLWLTSSTSPGQVQELDELVRELRRGKPLLPVITRSDVIEEDEVDGEIVRYLRNKSDFNRALQETDVQARATEKLISLEVDAALLKAPVSISCHVAQVQGGTNDALAEAGFGRLYEALLNIVGPALAYKQRKPAEMQLHFSEEQVLGKLRSDITPMLRDLENTLQDALLALELQQNRVTQMAWREVAPMLPEVLERHALRRDVQAVSDEVTQLVVAAFERQARENLAAYVLPSVTAANLALPEGLDYEIDSSGITDAVDGAVFIGYEKLYAALGKSVQELLAELAGTAISTCADTLKTLDACVVRKQEIIATYECQLFEIERELHIGSSTRTAPESPRF